MEKRKLTMYEREETAIGLVIIDKKPLFLSLKIGPKGHQIGMPKPTNRFHMTLEHLLGGVGSHFSSIKALHCDDQTVVQHRFVRRP